MSPRWPWPAELTREAGDRLVLTTEHLDLWLLVGAHKEDAQNAYMVVYGSDTQAPLKSALHNFDDEDWMAPVVAFVALKGLEP